MTLRASEVTGQAPPFDRKLAFYEIEGPQPREFFFYQPTTHRAAAPLVVSVHGIARNAAAHAYRLMAEAERYGLSILAPLFRKEQFGQYQQLADPETGARSDLALFDMLDATARFAHADVSKVLLFGYSGGAQFAHRFAMAHPERVASAVLAAAGWYTFPSPRDPYPYGLLTDARLPVHFELSAIARVPFHVVVGDLDVERDGSLRQSKSLDRMQGHTRIERALNWTAAMGRLAAGEQARAPAPVAVLSGVGHSFIDSVERAGLQKFVFDRFAGDAGLTPAPGAV